VPAIAQQDANDMQECRDALRRGGRVGGVRALTFHGMCSNIKYGARAMGFWRRRERQRSGSAGRAAWRGGSNSTVFIRVKGARLWQQMEPQMHTDAHG
jgi:hypothetical protein